MDSCSTYHHKEGKQPNQYAKDAGPKDNGKNWKDYCQYEINTTFGFGCHYHPLGRVAVWLKAGLIFTTIKLHKNHRTAKHTGRKKSKVVRKQLQCGEKAVAKSYKSGGIVGSRQLA